jgi:hypothetical protein
MSVIVLDFLNATSATSIDPYSVLDFLAISVDGFDTLLSNEALLMTSEDELFDPFWR